MLSFPFPSLRRADPAMLAATFALAAFTLAGCSLSIEDPEVEARKKLAKLVEPTWELLEGRWLGDSTYTIFDDRAAGLKGRMILDFHPDSTFWAIDSSRLVLAGESEGPARLSLDTLVLPAARNKAEADTFAVRLRFLGNYLELGRRLDQRFAHFHKVKPYDDTTLAALLDTSLWLRLTQRIAHDTTRREALRKDFDYLSFSGDSLYRDTRRDGISRVEGGGLSRNGRRWTWSPASGARTLHLDLFHPDSLRLWPYNAGRPDSGFSLYARTTGRSALDLDVTPFAGHLRTDSLEDRGNRMETHYGRYYDLVLGADHSVTTHSVIPSLPRFRAWSMDSGFLWLEGPTGVKSRLRVERPTEKTLRILTDAGNGFPFSHILWLTLVDGPRILANPMERFAQASYLHLEVGGDSLKYYFSQASNRNSPEEHEIARIDSVDTLWAAWRFNAAQETFGSSQPGFLFAFHGRNAALGRYTCRSVPGKDMAIRTLASPDPTLARGLVQGACQLTAVERGMPADSTLALTGEFRSKRRLAGLHAPFWRQP